MKLLIFLTFIAVCLAAVCATRCKTPDDCGKGFCCVGLSVLHMRARGICAKLARKGRRCNEPESKMDYYGGKFILYCPCDEGMSCTPYRLKEGETDYEKKIASLRCQDDKVTKEPDNKSTKSDDRTSKPDITVPTSPSIPEIPKTSLLPTIPTEPEPQPETESEPQPEPQPETESEPQPEPEGDEETPKDFPDESQQGPGGEHPRDDDCEDWTYGC